MDEIRRFLIEKLTTGAQNLPHSLLNVLSSSLAIFLMKCLPDIWSEPFVELIQIWSVQQQELLLRFNYFKIIITFIGYWPKLRRSFRV